MIRYAWDLLYGIAGSPTALTRPKVWKGYFAPGERGEYQKRLFDYLLEIGFKRTRFQIVFPTQTAGLIKKLDNPTYDKPNEAHVRFYRDGVIDCELEYSRFDVRHWRGERTDGNLYLEEIIRGSNLNNQNAIISQLGKKAFTETVLWLPRTLEKVRYEKAALKVIAGAATGVALFSLLTYYVMDQ